MDTLSRAKRLFADHPNSRTAKALRRTLARGELGGAIDDDEVAELELSIAAWREKRVARRFGYRPIADWTWRRVVEARAHHTLAPRMFPVAAGSGVVGWAVPSTKPTQVTSPGAQLMTATVERRRGCDEGLSLAAGAVRKARRLRLADAGASTPRLEGLIDRLLVLEVLGPEP